MQRTVEAAGHFVALKDKYGHRDKPLIINMHMNHGVYITLPDKKVYMYERDFDTYMAAIDSFVQCCEEWIGDSDIKIALSERLRTASECNARCVLETKTKEALKQSVR